MDEEEDGEEKDTNKKQVKPPICVLVLRDSLHVQICPKK